MKHVSACRRTAAPRGEKSWSAKVAGNRPAVALANTPRFCSPPRGRKPLGVLNTESTMPTRIVKLELVELSKESCDILFAVADELRRGVNWWWRTWECYHTQHDSPAALVAEIEADRQWKAADKATRGERPKPSVSPIPGELNRALGTGLARRCPGVNSRTLTLTANTLGRTLRTKQSTAASCKWWRAILLDLDSRGTARKPQPIPLDGANCKVEPCDERGRVRISFRADRIVAGARGKSTLIEGLLKTDGKRAAYAKPAHEIAAGVQPLKQVMLTWDAKRRKWFAALTYQAEEIKAQINPDATAILRPGRLRCWRLRLPGGRSIGLTGRPNHVAHKRKSLLLQRWGRQHAYTYAPLRKGRGRDRALKPLFELTASWNNFTRRCNDEVTALLANILAEQGVGRLVLVTGDETRALATAGKIEGRDDSTGWPWHQFEQLCQQKLNRCGIEVVVKRISTTRNREKARNKKGLRQSG